MTQTQDNPPGGPSASGADPGPRVNRDQLHDLDGLRRSGTDRHVAGVAGGLGRHFGIDPTVIRVVLVAASFFGGAGLFLYVALWLLVPEDGRDHAPVHVPAEARRVLLVVVAAIALVGLFGSAWGGWGWHVAWPLGVAVLVVALVLRRGSRRGEAPRSTSYAAPPTSTPVPPPPRPRRPRRTGMVLFWPTLALIAVAWGGLGLYDIDHDVSVAHWPGIALGITGVMLLVGAFVGRPGGLILLGCLLTVALALAAALGRGGWPDRPRTYAPASAAAVAGRYHVDNGHLVVDLSRVADPADLDGRTIHASSSIGEVEVILPRGTAARVDAGLYVGDVTLGQRTHDGFRWTYDGRFGPQDADAVVDLVLRVRVGQIHVHAAPTGSTAAASADVPPTSVPALEGSTR